MSIDALSSSTVAFTGKKAGKSEKTDKKKPSATTKIANAISKPIKDSFHKKYGEDVKPTPALVGDYIVDKTLKIGVPVAAAILLFTKTRKMTNGLTKAVKENINSVQNKEGKLKDKFSAVVHNSMEQVKKNNLEEAQAAAKAAEEAAKKAEAAATVAEGAAETAQQAAEVAVKKGKGFFGRIVDKVRSAANIKGKDGKIDADKAVDVAASAAVTAASSLGVIQITEDVVTTDDAELAAEGKEAEKKVDIKVSPKYEKYAKGVTRILDTLGEIDA